MSTSNNQLVQAICYVTLPLDPTYQFWTRSMQNLEVLGQKTDFQYLRVPFSDLFGNISGLNQKFQNLRERPRDARLTDLHAKSELPGVKIQPVTKLYTQLYIYIYIAMDRRTPIGVSV